MPWKNDNNQLERTFTFKDFKEALVFTNKVGEIAERLNHHPVITLTWGKVTIVTTTHDAGNKVTDKDIELTREIDKLVS